LRTSQPVMKVGGHERQVSGHRQAVAAVVENAGRGIAPDAT
jgi:hypothetical protein